MKFSRIGKCVIALALVIAVSVTAVSAMSASGNTNVSSDDMTFSDYISVSVENKTSSEMAVAELDDKADFNINTDNMSVEEVLKLWAAKAKEITSQNDIIKLKMEWPAFGTMPYHALDQFIIQSGLRRICQGEVSFGETVALSFNLKLHSEYSENLRYLVFLYLLTKEYSDNVLFTGYYYDPIAFSCTPPTTLFVCNEYAQHGYDNIKDYYEAIRDNSVIAPVGAFSVDFASKSIMVSPYDPLCDRNLYEDIFDIPAPAGDIISEKTDAAGRKTIEMDKSSFALDINSNMSMESIFKVLAAKAEEITREYDLIKITIDTERSYRDYLIFCINTRMQCGKALEKTIVPVGEIKYLAPQGCHETIIKEVYDLTYNIKDYPEYREDIQYVVFLYLLSRNYSDCVLHTDLRHDSLTSRHPYDTVFVCGEYREYGYDDIMDYYIDFCDGKLPYPQNAYLMDCQSKRIIKLNEENKSKKYINNTTPSIYEEIFSK